MENVLPVVKEQTCLDSMLNLLIQKRDERTMDDRQVCNYLEVDATQLIT